MMLVVLFNNKELLSYLKQHLNVSIEKDTAGISVYLSLDHEVISSDLLRV